MILSSPNAAARSVRLLLGVSLAMVTLTASAAEPLWAKLAETSQGSADSYPLYVSVAPAVASVGVCKLPSTTRCAPGETGTAATKLVATRTDRKIFQTDAALALVNGDQYVIKGFDAAGTELSTQKIKLEAIPVVAQPGTGGVTPGTDGRIKLQDLSFAIPSGWKVHQDAAARGMLIVGLTNGTDYLRIYVKQGGEPDMQRTFVNGASVTKAVYSAQHGAQTWKMMETRKGTSTVSAFCTEKGGYAYWGYGVGASLPTAVVETLLKSVL